ncbi:MAG: tyrosine-type recombinase/integrase [Gammaproteobacteria bacterium]
MAINRKIMDRFLTQEEEKRLFQTVKQHNSIEAQRDLAWMMLLRSTGIRVGALSGLTVADARQALSDHHLTIRPEINKRRASYKIYLGKVAEQALRLLLKVRREMGHPEQWDAPLILSRESNAMSIRAFQQRCKKWRELAGVPHVSPHWFRHTLAMRIMQSSTAKDPRGVVMASLGHRSINSTAQYTQPDKQTLQNVMMEVG